MKLSILIVNWNTRDLVIRCVNSILAHVPTFLFEIIVVDNHSSDGSVEMLTNLFGPNRKIRVIQSLRNLGFARASNLAYKNSTGEYVFLLNPDTEILGEALKNLVSYMDENPGVGVLGPKLVNLDGSLQRSVRRFPGIFSSLLVFSGLHRFVHPRRYLMDDFTYQQVADVDQVMGAALLTRRSLVEKLGLFDENFYLWYEEVDYCKRVKAAGYAVRFYPQASVMHAGAQSFTQLKVFERKKIVAKSLVYYFRKNGSLTQVLAIGIAIPTVLFVALILDRLQKIFGFRLKPYV